MVATWPKPTDKQDRISSFCLLRVIWDKLSTQQESTLSTEFRFIAAAISRLAFGTFPFAMIGRFHSEKKKIKIFEQSFTFHHFLVILA